MALSLLASLLLITLVTELVALVGKGRISDAIYGVYCRVARVPGYQQQRALKQEILATKAELSMTSSQDEFAKWARLRRKVDKGIADLDRLNSELSTKRTAFTAFMTSIFFALTTILPFVYTSYHRTSPVFYVPKGWFGPTERVLSLPFAPAGAVSCAVWGIVTRRAVKFVGRTAADLAEGAFATTSKPVLEEPVAASPAPAARAPGKKEL